MAVHAICILLKFFAFAGENLCLEYCIVKSFLLKIPVKHYLSVYLLLSHLQMSPQAPTAGVEPILPSASCVSVHII